MEKENEIEIEPEILLIDEDYLPPIGEDEIEAFRPLLLDVLKSYAENKDKPLEEWVREEYARQLPELSEEEIRETAENTVGAVRHFEESKKSLQAYLESGRRKEDWLKEQLRKRTETMSEEERHAFLTEVAEGIQTAGEGQAAQLRLQGVFDELEFSQTSSGAGKTVSLAARETKETHSSEGESSGSGQEDSRWKQNVADGIAMAHASEYVGGIDQAIEEANKAFRDTVRTKTGDINMNPNLDGYLAEQKLAQSFNIKAASRGSKYRAKVLTGDGKRLAKGSVDIEIIDTETQKVIHKYQAKFCGSAKATWNAVKKGGYDFQQRIVSSDQVKELEKLGHKVTSYLSAPDGTTSASYTKHNVKRSQQTAQNSGRAPRASWKSPSNHDLMIGIGKTAREAGIMAGANALVFGTAQKLWDGKDIDGGELIAEMVKTGAEESVKTAVTTAIHAGVKRGTLGSLGKAIQTSDKAVMNAANTAISGANAVLPSSMKIGQMAGGGLMTTAAIANGAVEGAKAIFDVADGTCTPKEGFERVEQAAGATIGGIIGSGMGGTAVGAALGSVFGPVGTAVGGVIGNVIGNIAGSAIGKGVAKAAHTVMDVGVSAVKFVGSAVGSFASGCCNCVSNVVGAVCSLFD